MCQTVPQAGSFERIAMLKTTVAAAAIVAAATASAQEPASGILLKGAADEVLAQTARISGAAVAGAMIVGPQASTLPLLSARIPAAWAGTDICVTLVSDDGRYEASRDYSVSTGWSGGLADIPYPTRYGDFLKATTAETLGVTVQKGGCAAAEDEYALAGWNAEIGSEPETATLLVNSYRADETYLISHDTDEEVACEEIRSERRTAFDFACELPSHLIYGEGAVTLEVNRIRDGQIETAKVIDISRTARTR